MSNFYKKKKLSLRHEKYDQLEYRHKISDIRKKLEILCENDCFDNDTRLNRLMINDESGENIKILSHK